MNRCAIPGRLTVRGFAIAAALLGAAALPGAGPAAAQTAMPLTGTLPSGVAYEVRADPATPAAAVALWFRAPSSGFDGKPVAVLSRLAATTVAASVPITGTPLGRLVDRFGGRITVAAYPDSVSVTALVPADRLSQTVRAMTAAYFAPVITPDGLLVARRDVDEEASYRSYNPSDAIEDALGAALFATGPLHDGTLATTDLAGVGIERVRAFAERAFRPANTILVLTGNVGTAALSDVAARPGAEIGAEKPALQTPRPAGSPELSREANAQGIGLGWIGPPISDEAAATALDFASDALFAPKTGIVQRALGTRKVSVTGKFVTYRNPGVFLVTISGDDAAAARPIVEQAIAAAAAPMSDAAFASARAGFVYRLLGDMDTPPELADTYGWYAVEGAPGYAPAEGGAQGRYFSFAAALTPASVAQTVGRYLRAAPAVVTLVKARPAAPVQKRT